MRTWMTAVRAPMHDSLRRRLATAIVIAVAVVSAPAAPALAGTVADAPCTPKDPVCLNKPATAPSPAPANQTTQQTDASAKADAAAKAAAVRAGSRVKTSVPQTSFWDDLS